jgi:LytS/YehU family sensor histidine kinase
MISFEMPILFHWIDGTMQIAQRLFIVVVAAFIAIRMKGVRQALRGASLKWQYQLGAMLVFGLLSIIGTHSGVLLNIGDGNLQLNLDSAIPIPLKQNQALISFRDTMALVSGLIGGPFAGLGAGIIGGAERYQLGGLASMSSSMATVLLGLYAGLLRKFRLKWIATANGVFWAAIIGSLLHWLLIIVLVHPFKTAQVLSWEVFVPISIVNCLGCVLFFWIMRDLDKDHLECEANAARLLAVQSELRWLRAQVDPHFLNKMYKS